MPLTTVSEHAMLLGRHDREETTDLTCLGRQAHPHEWEVMTKQLARWKHLRKFQAAKRDNFLLCRASPSQTRHEARPQVPTVLPDPGRGAEGGAESAGAAGHLDRVSLLPVRQTDQVSAFDEQIRAPVSRGVSQARQVTDVVPHRGPAAVTPRSMPSLQPPRRQLQVGKAGCPLTDA